MNNILSAAPAVIVYINSIIRLFEFASRFLSMDI